MRTPHQREHPKRTCPMCKAAYEGKIDEVKALFLNDFFCNHKRHQKGYYAVAGGNSDVITFFLLNGIDLLDSINATIKYGRYEVFLWLLGNFPSIQNEINVKDLNFKIAKGGSVNIVKELIKEMNINFLEIKNGWTPFSYACKYGNIEFLDFLLSNYPEIKKFKSSAYNPLIIASKFNQPKVIDYLLKNTNININIEQNKETPLIVGIKLNKIEVVKELLKSNSLDINIPKSNPPLIQAIYANHFEIIKLLIKDKRININSKNEIGIFP